MNELAEIKLRFRPRKWKTPLEADISEQIRHDFEEFATGKYAELPAGREREIVMTKLQEAAMWAQTALAAGFRRDEDQAAH